MTRDFSDGFEGVVNSMQEGILDSFNQWYTKQRSAVKAWTSEHPIVTSIGKTVVFSTLLVLFALSLPKKHRRYLHAKYGNDAISMFDYLKIKPTTDKKEIEDAYERRMKEVERDEQKQQIIAAYAFLKKLA